MRIGFDEAMDDDLNLPEAMGIVFSGLRDVNRVLDTGSVAPNTQRTLQHLLEEVDSVLGVLALVARDQPGGTRRRGAALARRARRGARGPRLREIRSPPRSARGSRHRGGGHAAGAALEADRDATRLIAWTFSTGAIRCSRRCARVGRRARSWSRAGSAPRRASSRSSSVRRRGTSSWRRSRASASTTSPTPSTTRASPGTSTRARRSRSHDLLDEARPPALLVVLDGIQDPQNVGAIARSAEACGADGIVVPRHHAAPLTAAAVKASAGATEHLPMVTVPNLAQALEVIGAAGIWRVGLDAAGAGRATTPSTSRGPTAIVVGAEGAGMRRLTREHCDVLVSIPMLGHVASLNAGAAAAVLLFEVQRQRGFAPR